MTQRVTASIAVFIAGLCTAGLADAQGNAVEPLKTWSGRVPLDERPPLQTSIAKAGDWTRIWKQCRIKEPAPKVDFQKTLGLVAVRRGSLVEFSRI